MATCEAGSYYYYYFLHSFRQMAKFPHLVLPSVLQSWKSVSSTLPPAGKGILHFFFYLLQLCCLALVCILLWKEGDWDNHLGNTIDWGGQGLAYGAERKGGSAL